MCALVCVFVHNRQKNWVHRILFLEPQIGSFNVVLIIHQSNFLLDNNHLEARQYCFELMPVYSFYFLLIFKFFETKA